MIVRVNLSAITQNAAFLRTLADAAGVVLAAVVKDAYALPAILDAVIAGGIETICVSSCDAVASYVRSLGCQAQLIRLPLPEDADAIVRAVDASLHVSEETLAAIASIAPPSSSHKVWLGLRTSDEREGISEDDLQNCFQRLARAPKVGVVGLLAHWGCRHEVPPAGHEVARITRIASDWSGRVGSDLRLSLGGSVLLPILSELQIPKGTQLRVGEAILTGTIPGQSATIAGLLPTCFVDGKVVQVHTQSTNGVVRAEAIVNCGSSSVDWTDLREIHSRGGVRWGASNMTGIELSDVDDLPKIGHALTFALGYRSALRALSARAVEISYVP